MRFYDEKNNHRKFRCNFRDFFLITFLGLFNNMNKNMLKFFSASCKKMFYFSQAVSENLINIIVPYRCLLDKKKVEESISFYYLFSFRRLLLLSRSLIQVANIAKEQRFRWVAVVFNCERHEELIWAAACAAISDFMLTIINSTHNIIASPGRCRYAKRRPRRSKIRFVRTTWCGGAR